MRSTGITGIVTFKNINEALMRWLQKADHHSIIEKKSDGIESLDFMFAFDKCNYKNPADGIYILFAGYLRDDILEVSGSYEQTIYSLYMEHGIEMLNLIDGSYSLVIIDLNKQITYIACDRLATQPMYYNISEETVSFSSFLSDFRYLPTLKKNINLTAVASMLGSGWVHNSDTYFENVYFLPGGNYISISKEGPEVIKYWDYKIEKDDGEMSKDEYKKKLQELLIKAVEKRTRNNIPALLLSGGVDSRLLLGVMRELGRPVNTYSYSYNELSGDDCFVAEQAAKKAGVKFDKLVIDNIDPYKGMLISASCWSGMRNWVYEYEPLSILSEVSQNWMAGDESFGWHNSNYVNDYDFMNHVGINFISQQKGLKRLINSELYEELLKRDRLIYDEISRRRGDYDLFDSVDYIYTTERLPRNILPCRYIVTQQGCNLINPWLDKDILEFMRSLPQQYRTNKNLVREIAKDMYPDLFSIPPAKFGGASRFVKEVYTDQEKIKFLLEESSEFYSNKVDFERLADRLLKKENPLPRTVTKAKYKFLRKLNRRLDWLPKGVSNGNMPINITNQQLIDRLMVMGIICNRELGLKL